MGQTVHVQQPIGSAWLMLNWPSVLMAFFLSLFPLYFLYTRYQKSSQYASSLFDFTLAEQQRKLNDTKALINSIRIYDKILQGACNVHIEWRAYFGRSIARLQAGESKASFLDASKALELAQKLVEKQEASDKKKKNKKGAAEGEAKEGEAEAEPEKPVDEFDIDPFEDAPISLPALYYQRARALDAMKDFQGANADYAKAVELDRSKSFVEGYVARRELEDRMERGVPYGVPLPSDKKQEPKSTTSTSASKNVPLDPKDEPVKSPKSPKSPKSSPGKDNKDK